MIDTELKKRIVSSVFLLPFTLFFIFNDIEYLIVFLILLLIISIYEWYFISKNQYYLVLGLIFIFFAFYSTYNVRTTLGFDIFLAILFSCISTDLGGYVIGKIFKGPKITKISPGKTYSGFIGACFLSVLSLLCLYKLYFVTNKSINFIILAGIIISTVSHFGDITMSYFKRLKKIKDTGKIIPGHGGLLDRIDGMIFVFPFVYILKSINLI